MKIHKALWFGLSCIGLVLLMIAFLTPWDHLTTGHIGLLMLALIVVAIMLGFPTAFTLMGMGVLFTFLAYYMQSSDAGRSVGQTLDLMVQRTYATMTNDSLISIPLFVFMGYLVERANLIEKLFRSMHLALARLPGALAVATLATCAIFATATGIVGAVVTLMGLLAMPAMLKAGYSVRLTAGSITAGGCLGILLPPSVMLIVYGATTGVSVVQLYAGALFPGIMLAVLYMIYVIIVAKLRPDMAPPLPKEERGVPLSQESAALASGGYTRAVSGMLAALFKGRRNQNVPLGFLMRNMALALAPLAVTVLLVAVVYQASTRPEVVYEIPAELQLGSGGFDSGLSEPPADGLAEPPSNELAEPPSNEPAAPTGLAEPPGAQAAAPAPAAGQAPPAADAGIAAPKGFWIFAGICAAILVVFYAMLTWARMEIFKMLMASFFPLAVMIAAVLGSIAFGLATPSEAAAMGAMGGALLALAYRRLNLPVLRESVFLTAKTSAMVCWLFVGSSIFSAAFALLGGQRIIEEWVLSLGLSQLQFLLLAQVIIFLLGWPLEWTEIIVIFMPIFVPLLNTFGIDPLFFGLLVALNLQTAFLSPPVAMSAFYLKGVSPPHVTLNQIFLGMMPFMGIQVVAIFLLYVFPGIGMWLPTVLYR
ncbi:MULTISPECIES: TRAP transporter large permease [Achromobacter]|jgi:TRAP-type mannitol/chloroaromatic compound transport system permease large subunit|uniref:TRAP transporter large permease n=1 Tax=Achromobacter TaxID=222 RepID=UPI0007C3454C|nr:MULTISPECIES: TRAP transporter large permease subunit [Achromobacter]GLK95060.1 C4-dicarboxylate ABC transporter [Achromobacter xylosoxidans]AVG39691.1 C4-dicarboxylate ABC transporter [Achromobacter insolitus]AXA70372.1 C4-dicarboxylate ABC transporter [Achromobacter insolitus]MEB3099239.1 TRAP transporter large permease subunit [Achromobacter sp. D10]NGT18465.1 TRAP transporter large permease subunit [Achromobacter insolitus]